ncbi:MAG: phosphoribosylanthranilate isomerase [Deltaproteobacteria bacterium]
MHKVSVKICGITNLMDACTAVRLGADALGFIFAPSPRRIAPQTAREIIRALPPFVKSVGVFAHETPASIRKVINDCSLDLVQLHGDESPALCDELMPYTIKALRVKDESSLQSGQAYHGKVRALLLDTYSKEKAGGTGRTFDWKLASKLKKHKTPIILSGGLTPANIAAAIHIVKPYAVDVNSGVEERPGKKSQTLIRDLMENVRQGMLAEYKTLKRE